VHELPGTDAQSRRPVLALWRRAERRTNGAAEADAERAFGSTREEGSLIYT
jgi:hypothetical protein